MTHENARVFVAELQVLLNKHRIELGTTTDETIASYDVDGHPVNHDDKNIEIMWTYLEETKSIQMYTCLKEKE